MCVHHFYIPHNLPNFSSFIFPQKILVARDANNNTHDKVWYMKIRSGAIYYIWFDLCFKSEVYTLPDCCGEQITHHTINRC